MEGIREKKGLCADKNDCYYPRKALRYDLSASCGS